MKLLIILVLSGSLLNCTGKTDSNNSASGPDKKLSPKHEPVKEPLMKPVKPPEKKSVAQKKAPPVPKPIKKLLPLGIKDKGVFSKFDSQITLEKLSGIDPKKTYIYVNKKARTLTLYHNYVAAKVYPIALGGAPKGKKIRQGDKKTPEGKYAICERKLFKKISPRYGSASLLLTYPGVHDAKRGLASKLITKAQYTEIDKLLKDKKTPLQNTTLGSSIRIHGGGVDSDWTLGCIALRDEDAIELYHSTSHWTPVHIVPDWTPGDKDGDGIADQLDILIGAKKLILNKSDYDPAYFSIKYPWGDVPENKGVCTDVIIRAMRNAGIDLQSLMYDNIMKNRNLYPRIKKPDRNIDHRRVGNMLVYFRYHYNLISNGWSEKTKDKFLPGDIIFMDTITYPGPDHVGIISDRKDSRGNYLVINNWASGCVTAEMDILDSVSILYHYRVK
ncbi:DUF1287 domain-containing protein [Myxococcota bacterium]|nr:DUF1287 domain-containing protein [Myxococcota bacterium]MBU1379667.1 DUF1287 domain-containing protein [Myxococcota bacterium]MBU1497496.1 DUF1287 domain-containing protein [Myxococcota bacterium]